MDTKLGNPAPLGLIAFASTTWLLSLVNAGFFDEKSVVLVLSMALVFGGVVQAIAGIIAFMRGNTFPGVAFLAYGAFWISFATYAKFFGGGAPAAFVGCWLFGWGVFSFYMWIATFRHNTALQLTFLTLWVTFLLLAAADLFGMPSSPYGGRIPRSRLCSARRVPLRGGNHQRRFRPDGASSRAVCSTSSLDPNRGWREAAYGLVNLRTSGGPLRRRLSSPPAY